MKSGGGLLFRQVVGLVVVAVMLVVSGCSGEDAKTEHAGTRTGSDQDVVTASTTTAGGGAHVEAKVTAAGFEIEMEDVVVSAPAGVAPVGTVVTVQLLEPELEIEDAEIVQTVDVQLGDGLQPDQPITLAIAASRPLSETSAYVVMRSDSNQQNYANIAHESAPGQIVVHTSHLSTFTMFWFDPSKWLRDLQEQVELALGLQHPKPGCIDENLGRATDLGGFDFTAEGPGLGTVWLCAGRAATGDLSMQVYSNSPAAFEITADKQPTGIVQIADLSLAEILITSLYNVSSGHRADRSLLAPGGSLSFRASEGDVPVGYHATYQSGWSAVAVGLEAALNLVSFGRGGAAATAIQGALNADDVAGCLVGAIENGLVPQPGLLVAAGLSCFQSLAGQVGELSPLQKLSLAKIGLISAAITLLPQAFVAIMIELNASEFSLNLYGTAVSPTQVRESVTDYTGFVTPSGNIFCSISTQTGDGYQPLLTCQIYEKDYQVEPIEDGCTFGMPEGSVNPSDADPGQIGFYPELDSHPVHWFCITDELMSTAWILDGPGSDRTSWRSPDDETYKIPVEIDGEFIRNDEYAMLAYGMTLRAGRFECSSASTGLTCSDTVTGRGFEISSSEWREF